MNFLLCWKVTFGRRGNGINTVLIFYQHLEKWWIFYDHRTLMSFPWVIDQKKWKWPCTVYWWPWKIFLLRDFSLGMKSHNFFTQIWLRWSVFWMIAPTITTVLKTCIEKISDIKYQFWTFSTSVIFFSNLTSFCYSVMKNCWDLQFAWQTYRTKNSTVNQVMARLSIMNRL